MKKKLITATLVLSLLSGSAMGQKKYQRPPIKTPDEFRGAEPTSPVDAKSIGDLKWFEVFPGRSAPEACAHRHGSELRPATSRCQNQRSAR